MCVCWNLCCFCMNCTSCRKNLIILRVQYNLICCRNSNYIDIIISIFLSCFVFFKK
eukprot:UN01633